MTEPILNAYDMEDTLVHEVVDNLANIYQENLINDPDDKYISDDVLPELSAELFRVPTELRQYAFRAFLEELDRRNLPYIIDHFKGNA